MKRFIIILLVVFLSGARLWAQDSDTLRTINVEGVVVKAARSLRDIGVQKSPLSEQVLTESVTLSMAEVLAKNSTIFIKSSGRATLATASLRGTAPSHTAVSWNGIDLSSPMLGMVDFSMIPSYFVDNGEVYHGATSVGVTGGGLGGAVVLGTDGPRNKGIEAQYVQNIASYNTFDEFVRLSVTRSNWGSSTRLLFSSSDNDFPYINRDKVGHPLEYNKSCGYNDMHLLQELFYTQPKVGHLSLKGWYTDSSRGIPKLTVDFRDDDLTKAWQDERNLRGVAEWKNSYGGLRLNAKAGYSHSLLHYIYQFSLGGGEVLRGVDSSSTTTHAFAEMNGEWSLGNTLMLAGNVRANRYDVESEDVAPLVPTGYAAFRNEMSAFVSARWQPAAWLGTALSMREEWRDGVWSPPIPALFVDATLWPEIGLIVSGSATRNYRYPTLNDLYYVPGGNPNLMPEQGISGDLGIEASFERERVKASAKLTGYHSDINNWILWEPTVKGFWTPRNLQRVVSRGVEARANVEYSPRAGLSLECRTIIGYTNSVNATEGSNSYGNQLPYIPRWSASAAVLVRWEAWQFDYKWHLYSDRQTSYSGTSFSSDVVDGYHLSDISLSRTIRCKNKVSFKVRFDINNLFNAEYQSVLSRPMPPRNYALCIECRWSD